MMLNYRPHGMIEDLAPFECTVHRASGSGPGKWWQLWFNALRDTDGKPELFCVPIQVGSYVENGPGGRTWGVSCPQASAADISTGTRNWMVSPSINVLNDRDAISGKHAGPSLWHHTPEIVGVPVGESWATGSAA